MEREGGRGPVSVAAAMTVSALRRSGGSRSRSPGGPAGGGVRGAGGGGNPCRANKAGGREPLAKIGEPPAEEG
jgi:hypothetical protein